MYEEWDQETQKQDENFEISSEARDYNNQDLNESRADFDIEDNSEPDGPLRNPYSDPYQLIEGGMATTDTYSLWSKLMPVFKELTRLDYFRGEIKSGAKQHKDFYVYFRQNLLGKFDACVSEQVQSVASSFGGDKSLNLRFWNELPWDIRVKTYLTLYAVEIEA